MEGINIGQVGAALLLYAALFVTMRMTRYSGGSAERFTSAFILLMPGHR